MSNYSEDIIDIDMSPSIIEARYRIGRSIFFDTGVGLADKGINPTNSIKDPIILQTALALESKPLVSGSTGLVIGQGYGSNGSYGGGSGYIPGGGGYVPPVGGCPVLTDYIWVGDVDKENVSPRAILISTLVNGRGKDEYLLYNPITRNFNKIISLRIIENSPLYKVTTNKGIIFNVSQSHKIIANTQDIRGHFLRDHVPGSEMLVMDENFDIYRDFIIEIKDNELDSVLEISLEKEFIYASGEKGAALGHNRKDDSAFEDLNF